MYPTKAPANGAEIMQVEISITGGFLFKVKKGVLLGPLVNRSYSSSSLSMVINTADTPIPKINPANVEDLVMVSPLYRRSRFMAIVFGAIGSMQ